MSKIIVFKRKECLGYKIKYRKVLKTKLKKNIFKILRTKSKKIYLNVPLNI